MALIDDIFKANLTTGLAVGVGAAILAPSLVQAIGRVLRPAAKAMIKSGLVFYRETLSEIGELASDLVAEARAELEHDSDGERVAATADGEARTDGMGEQHQPSG
jgi:hypothetical protein